jgi:predicted O-linked N-acetylglucosamine transferase (SPINDLY family)
MTAALNRAARRKAERLQGRKSRGNGAAPANLVAAAVSELLTAAVEQHRAGNLPVAEKAYRQVLEIRSDNFDALHLLGVVMHQKGAGAEAVHLIEKAIRLDANNAACHINLGAVLKSLGRVSEAERSYRRALAIDPQSAEALVNLGILLADRGSTDEAIATFEAVLDHDPNTPKVLKRLGDLELARERFDQAEERFKKYLELRPADAEVRNNLGYVLERQEKYEDACRQYGEACELMPDLPEFNENLGKILARLGRSEEAEPYLQKALALNPEAQAVQANLAATYLQNGVFEKSIETYERLLQVQPDDADGWNSLGTALASVGQVDKAEEAIGRALEINPEFAEAHNNLGNIYLSQDKLLKAEEAFRKALEIRPRYGEAQYNLCQALKLENKLDQANILSHAALILEGNLPERYIGLSRVFRASFDTEGLDALGDPWQTFDDFEPRSLPAAFLELLVLAEEGPTNERLLGLHEKWGGAMERVAAAHPLPPRKARKPGRKVRIAFLSSDFRTHSVAKFILPLMEHYDRARFEIYCYSTATRRMDPMQQKIEGFVDKFMDVENFSNRAIAAAIRDDAVDILFELNGFTRHSRLPTLSYKPAPVQIEWLGYPFTTGLKAIDYLLVDPYLKPARDDLLVEKPLVMPGAWVCFGDFEDVAIWDTLPVERNGVITFGTLNNTYKFAPEMVKIWAEVMHAVPDSRFLVVRPECGSMVLCRNVAHEFEKRGIGPERLHLVANTPLEHLPYYNEIDISLDTAPLTGGTTTCDALWMGVPVVTLAGESVHQRISHAVLNHCGAGELSTSSVEEFKAKAVMVADDRPRLAAYRQHLREMMQASPLCQEARFIEDFQETMTAVAERHGLG